MSRTLTFGGAPFWVLSMSISEALPALEAQRAAIQLQISQLGDMRAGSITTTGGGYGNARSRCHRKDDPGPGRFIVSHIK